MHWIDHLTIEERKRLYIKYEKICYQIYMLMFVSFLLVVSSLILGILNNNYLILVIFMIIHGSLGGLLITLSNTITAIRYLRVKKETKYHQWGLYFGFYVIPKLSHQLFKEIVTIR